MKSGGEVKSTTSMASLGSAVGSAIVAGFLVWITDKVKEWTSLLLQKLSIQDGPVSKVLVYACCILFAGIIVFFVVHCIMHKGEGDGVLVLPED